MSESVEYLLRQQGKVKTPKSLVKVVRAHTRELKRATRREHEKAQVEALSGIAREAIRGSFDVVERGVEATGSVLSSLAGNPNPLSQGIVIGGGLIALSWLITYHPGIAKLLGLDKLIFSGQGAKGYDFSGEGSFCVRYKPLLGSQTDICFDSETERAAFLTDQPGVRALNPFLYEKALFGPFDSYEAALPVYNEQFAKIRPPGVGVQVLRGPSGKWYVYVAAAGLPSNYGEL